jgi:uncharacterized protein YqgC (DUF456 family)
MPSLQRVAAYSLLVAGVAGLVLPIIPGIPLLLIAIRLFGPDHFLTRPVFNWINRRR